MALSASSLSYTTVSLMMMTMPDIGSVTTLTSAHIANFAYNAESLIDAKISKNYSIPFTSTPPLLQTLATEIGLYNVFTRRIMVNARLKDNPWTDRYAESLKVLEDIASGKIALLNSSGTLIDARSDVAQVWSNTMDYIPTFSELGRLDQIQDEDKIDALLSERDL